MSIEARISQIYICPEAGAPMVRVGRVRAIEGAGLAGDRYAEGRGFWQTLKNPRLAIRHVSLISQSDIDEANAEFGIIYDGEKSRRNLVVEGEIDLLGLVGRLFRVGKDVVMRGAEECTPCKRPAQLSGVEGFEKAFRPRGRGGLRAEILTSGTIYVSDWLVVNED